MTRFTKCLNSIVKLTSIVCLFSPLFVQSASIQKLHTDNPDANYIGSASCSSSNCHGAGSIQNQTNVRQNEFNTWFNHDPHANAYVALESTQGKQIANNLGLGDATKAQICLNCHTTNVPVSRQSGRFRASEGVSCEGCHGPGSLWLSNHSNPNTARSELMSQGLYDTWSSTSKAELCLSCHLGDQNQRITHKIMAAGHPRLVFELVTFTDAQPRHYDVDEDYIYRKKPYRQIKEWAVGQAQYGYQFLDLLLDTDKSENTLFPELSMYECHTCHHNPKKIRWNRLDGEKEEPGRIKINGSSLLITQLIANVIAPEYGDRIGQLRAAIRQKTISNEGNISEIAAQGKELFKIVKETFQSQTITNEDGIAILEQIVTIGRKGTLRELSSAEQSVMAIALITKDLPSNSNYFHASSEISSVLEGLYKVLSDENAFSPQRLKNNLKKLKVLEN